MRNAVCGLLKGVAIGAALVLFGCGGSGGGSSAKKDKPSVQVVNASPDSTALDFSLQTATSTQTLGSKIAYLGTSSTYATFDPDDYDVMMKEDGGATEIDRVGFQPAYNQDFLTIGVGLENFGTEYIKRLRLTNIQIDRTVPNGTKARLIVLNAFLRPVGFDPPAIDFQDGDNPKVQFTNIGFDSSQNQLVDAGTYTFQARANGTSNVYVQGDTTLEAGKIYLVVVSGVEDATGAQAPTITYIPLATRD